MNTISNTEYSVIAPLIMGQDVGDGKTTACLVAQAATIDEQVAREIAHLGGLSTDQGLLADPEGTFVHSVFARKLERELTAMKDRAELAEASAKLWEADALRYANNTEFWKDRAEKAEAELKQMQSSALTWARFAGDKASCADLAEQRAQITERLWKEFITLMEITEESDSGYAFNVNKISSCRAMDGKRLNEILNEARTIVF